MRLFLYAALAALAPACALAAQLPEAFAACAACHTPGPGALGPDLDGVVGRKAGTAPGFRYSGPMRRSGLVWTPANLTRYLEDPQQVVPGNRMPMNGIPEDQAKAIVGYLAEQH